MFVLIFKVIYKMTQVIAPKRFLAKVSGHLFIPFGCPKWKIADIHPVAVSPQSTSFESSTQFVYINKHDQTPKTMKDFSQIFQGVNLPPNTGANTALSIIGKYLRENSELQTDCEKRFLDLYFEHCKNTIRQQNPSNPLLQWTDFVLPIPQAHLYLSDPFADADSAPDTMIKVDFLFWTGKEMVAIEIDGKDKTSADINTRDCKLRAAGVREIIRILNSDLIHSGAKAITSQLPRSITNFWDQENIYF
jgi:hypothetical protein